MEPVVLKWGVVRHMEKNHCNFQCSKLTEETLQSEFSVTPNYFTEPGPCVSQEHRAAIDISS